jgi:hypothetical protein
MPKSDTLRVLYPDGRFAYHVSHQAARQLIRANLAEPLGNRQSVHAVQLISGPSKPVAGTKYSHNHETQDNPRNVFALRNILHLDRGLFTRVQSDCIRGAIESVKHPVHGGPSHTNTCS